jgi:hypothetical protein
MRESETVWCGRLLIGVEIKKRVRSGLPERLVG